MLIVRSAAEENGARANQTTARRLKKLPDGWLEIPAELESAARACLPWLGITVENGAVTAVYESAEARAAWEAALAAEAAAQAAQTAQQ